MKISQWSISKVTPYQGNPRKNEAAIAGVRASIREFKINKPIVVDINGVIICGHTLYYAAVDEGLEKVPVHVASHLTPAQVRAYRIADNKTAEAAEWDYDLLAMEFRALQEENYELSLTAFDAAELDNILSGCELPAAAAGEVTGTDPGQGAYREQYGVIVVCESEAHQQRVYEELAKAGYACRVVCT